MRRVEEVAAVQCTLSWLASTPPRVAQQNVQCTHADMGLGEVESVGLIEAGHCDA